MVDRHDIVLIKAAILYTINNTSLTNYHVGARNKTWNYKSMNMNDDTRYSMMVAGNIYPNSNQLGGEYLHDGGM